MELAFSNTLGLLQELIRIESYSGVEHKAADILFRFLNQRGIKVQRYKNNVWARSLFSDDSKPSVLLNSHHDTVKPSTGYTRNPFDAALEGDVLYGLGSNDAGASLVALLSTFVQFFDNEQLPFNLVFVASAEEEISGRDGIECVLPLLGKIDCGIVGEPTQLQMAVAEKGLLVLDCKVQGVAGHAAREEGENAIYKTLPLIEWFKNYQFPRVSDTLGKVKMTVTTIDAGKQHNVIPATCNFTVDVRSTDCYSNTEILEHIQKQVDCEIQARSTRLNASGISLQHPLVLAGKNINRTCFGSATLSDQALMNFPTIKLGPGHSARSHSADEFVLVSEIEEAIHTYGQLLNALKF